MVLLFSNHRGGPLQRGRLNAIVATFPTAKYFGCADYFKIGPCYLLRRAQADFGTCQAAVTFIDVSRGINAFFVESFMAGHEMMDECE